MKKKAEKIKELNLQRKSNQENTIKSIENKRKKKIKNYFAELEKKDQYLIINKLIKSQRLRKKISHENEILELVQEHKHQIELNNEIKKKNFFEKMDKIDKRVDSQRKKIEYESLKSLQESFVKQSEKDSINQRMRRMKEYRYELNNKRNEEKERRMQLLKTEQKKFREEKERANENFINQKNMIMTKFNSFIRGRKRISYDMIKKIYPDNKDLQQKIKKIQQKYLLNSFDNIDKINTSSDKSKIKSEHKKQLKDEIEKKVTEFRKRLRAEITKEIENERIREINRIKEYEDAKTLEEKKNIEIKNNKEREESKQIINDKNDNIENFVEEYRKKLLNNISYY